MHRFYEVVVFCRLLLRIFSVKICDFPVVVFCVCVYVLQKTQLKLQEVEIKTVQVSLQEEQRRSRRVQEDREALVNQLQTQIQQLQKERNDYYSKMQELKVIIGL